MKWIMCFFASFLMFLVSTAHADSLYVDEVNNHYGDIIDMAVKGASSEEEGKKLTCRMKAMHADVAAGYYESRHAFNKKEAMEIMTESEEEGSLNYVLMEMAVNQAYAGKSGKEVGDAIYSFCMSQPNEWVSNSDYTKAELAESKRVEEKWEKAGCFDKMEALTEVVMYRDHGAAEGQLRKMIMDAVDNQRLAQKMSDALMRSEEDYFNLVDQYEQSCGS